jgi:penicillin-binding protein 2
LEQAGFTQDNIIGRSGVELYWDETLRGQPAFRLVIVAPTGEVLREIASTDAQPGQSLWLTLDADFQETVAQIVADAYTQAKDGWGRVSPGASAIVIDVNTGEILAMVSYPSFDNNAYNAFPLMGRQQAADLIEEYQNDPNHPEVNRPAQGLFALGSVMKTVTATATADSGVYALDERYTCIGVWNRDITRYDWLPQGHGTQTLAQALTHSCNPYFYETGYNLFMADPWILPTYARRFGFGGYTGMEDIAEEEGFIPDPDWFRTARGYDMTFSDEVNMAVGQGELQVTPLQVVRWFGALANGGTLWRPYLVRDVGLLGEERHPAHEPEGTPINVQADVMATIQGGLCAVTTDPSGTAEFVFRDSELQTIGVCGKTGTAQTGGPATPSHAWFAAWAPRENPQIAVVVLVETAGEGSEVAAPIARHILEAYFGMTP